jgi:hypothetical protein
MAEAKRDQNHVPGLIAETNDSNRTATPLVVDPITKRLLVTATVSNLGGLLAGLSFDTIDLVQATLTDTWTYYSSAVLVATITVTFTDAGKNTISSIVRS